MTQEIDGVLLEVREALAWCDESTIANCQEALAKLDAFLEAVPDGLAEKLRKEREYRKMAGMCEISDDLYGETADLLNRATTRRE